MTRITLIALAALAIGGCDVQLNVRYDYSIDPGHAVGVEWTMNRSEAK